MQSVFKSIVKVVKFNFSFVFKGLRRCAIGFFHVMSYFSIQVNGKLNVREQSITMVIFQDTKCALKDFGIYGVI